ncbi:MAG: hypothetical protein KZQ95_06690 [Candidatus Thiodiazotropha sp. (ex Epidulcina cf. delphinae)]|nr:hypothetical protein [Candidatus Thiodiazotropha sp. (ex Epidulcina cf. delphinae)]
MKRRTVGILGLSGVLLTPFWVGANEVAVSGRLGSLGIGVEGTFGLSQRFNARLGVNRFDFEISETIDDIEYDLDLQWRSIALFADWHPFGSRFRFTAGLLRNNNEFTGSTAATTLTIGDTTYSDTGLDARLEFNKHAPYLGLGWGNLLTTGSGWGFNVDLGIMYQGSASVSLTPTGAAAVLVDPDDLDKEEQSFEDDIKLYRYYPVFSFGVSYRF